MEHRCTERYSSDLKILISKHNLPIAIGRIRNGSGTGVFVETDFADIECEHQLTLELLLNPANKSQRLELKAIVIHKAQKGFGAEIDIQQQEHADLFRELLHNRFSAHYDNNLFALAANN